MGSCFFTPHILQLLFSFLQLRLSRCVLSLQLLCLFEVFIHEIRKAAICHRSLCFHGVGDCPNYLVLGFYVFLITISWAVLLKMTRPSTFITMIECLRSPRSPSFITNGYIIDLFFYPNDLTNISSETTPLPGSHFP